MILKRKSLVQPFSPKAGTRTTIFFLLVEEETILMVGPKGISLALFLLLN